MFFKTIRLIFVMVLAVVFVACGGNDGDGEDTIDEMSKRDIIVIYKYYSPETCESSELKDKLQEDGELKNLTIFVENNNVICETYGKKNDGTKCKEEDSGRNYDASCVVGFDKD